MLEFSAILYSEAFREFNVAGLNLIGRRRLSKLDLGKIDFAGPEHRERNLTTLVRGTVGRAERAG